MKGGGHAGSRKVSMTLMTWSANPGVALFETGVVRVRSQSQGAHYSNVGTGHQGLCIVDVIGRVVVV